MHCVAWRRRKSSTTSFWGGRPPQREKARAGATYPAASPTTSSLPVRAAPRTRTLPLAIILTGPPDRPPPLHARGHRPPQRPGRLHRPQLPPPPGSSLAYLLLSHPPHFRHLGGRRLPRGRRRRNGCGAARQGPRPPRRRHIRGQHSLGSPRDALPEASSTGASVLGGAEPGTRPLPARQSGHSLHGGGAGQQQQQQQRRKILPHCGRGRSDTPSCDCRNTHGEGGYLGRRTR